jgi:integrase/recombinase XerD
MAAMSIYKVLRKAERFGVSFRVCDSKDAGVGSCDQFLTELSLRDCSVYTQRAYALGLAHFFSWLHASGGDPRPRHASDRWQLHHRVRARREAGRCRRAGSQKPRKPRTINHRLSVLASYFEYCIRRDTEDGRGPWKGRINPASGNPLTEELRHGMIGRDLPARQRQRDGFRRRIPRTLPKILEPAAIQKLIDSAGSYRDKAILILLSRAGQRIGDWSPVAGRHGILGHGTGGCRSQTATHHRAAEGCARSAPRARHRRFLADLRRVPAHRAPRGAGRSCRLDRFAERSRQAPSLCEFESALRYIGRKAGISVHPHLFRHTLAQGVLDTTGNIKVAQEILGHSHLSTTADLYLRVDQHAMVTALERAKANTERARSTARGHQLKLHSTSSSMTMKRSRNWSAPLRKLPRVEPPGGDS